MIAPPENRNFMESNRSESKDRNRAEVEQATITSMANASEPAGLKSLPNHRTISRSKDKSVDEGFSRRNPTESQQVDMIDSDPNSSKLHDRTSLFPQSNVKRVFSHTASDSSSKSRKAIDTDESRRGEGDSMKLHRQSASMNSTKSDDNLSNMLWKNIMISSRIELDSRMSSNEELENVSSSKRPASTSEEPSSKKDRPQSRKLYLSQEFSSDSRPSTASQRVTKAANKQALSPGSSDSPSHIGSLTVSKADFPIARPLAFPGFTNNLSWGVNNEGAIVRPPSRQSSAFPIHLADEREEDHSHHQNQQEFSAYDIEPAKPKRNLSPPELENYPSRSSTAQSGERSKPTEQSIRATTAKSLSNRNILRVIDISDNVDTEDRPPSRQKIGAQDLFEENQLSSQIPVTASAPTRKKKNPSNNAHDHISPGYYHPSSAPTGSIRVSSTTIPRKHRSNGNSYQYDNSLDRSGLSTTMSSQLRHDPISDGFLELDNENDNKDVFKIHISHSISPYLQSRVAYKVKTELPSSVSGAVKHTIQQKPTHLSVSPISVDTCNATGRSSKGKAKDFMSSASSSGSSGGQSVNSSWVNEASFRDDVYSSSSFADKTSRPLSRRNSSDRGAASAILPAEKLADQFEEDFLVSHHL
jgi:hypothetical protein